MVYDQILLVAVNEETAWGARFVGHLARRLL